MRSESSAARSAMRSYSSRNRSSLIRTELSKSNNNNSNRMKSSDVSTSRMSTRSRRSVTATATTSTNQYRPTVLPPSTPSPVMVLGKMLDLIYRCDGAGLMECGSMVYANTCRTCNDIENVATCVDVLCRCDGQGIKDASDKCWGSIAEEPELDESRQVAPSTSRASSFSIQKREKRAAVPDLEIRKDDDSLAPGIPREISQFEDDEVSLDLTFDGTVQLERKYYFLLEQQRAAALRKEAVHQSIRGSKGSKVGSVRSWRSRQSKQSRQTRESRQSSMNSDKSKGSFSFKLPRLRSKSSEEEQDNDESNQIIHPPSLGGIRSERRFAQIVEEVSIPAVVVLTPNELMKEQRDTDSNPGRETKKLAKSNKSSRPPRPPRPPMRPCKSYAPTSPTMSTKSPKGISIKTLGSMDSERLEL